MKDMTSNFLSCVGFDVKWTLEKYQQSKDCWSPIYEAIANSIDAIICKNETVTDADVVRVTFYCDGLDAKAPKTLREIVIKDTGCGLNNEEFERFTRLNDRSKGTLNKGSGRVQFLKFFYSSLFQSVYRDSSSTTGLLKREVELSSRSEFLSANAFIRCSNPQPAKADEQTGTTVIFKDVLQKTVKNQYEGVNLEKLKERIIEHFLLRFNEIRQTMPTIELVLSGNGYDEQKTVISSSDIPTAYKERLFKVRYKTVIKNGWKKDFTRIDKSETFLLQVFKLESEAFQKNVEAFTSKGEKICDAKLKLTKALDRIDGSHYIIALSGDYINQNTSETRGELNIPTDKEIREQIQVPNLLDEYEEYLTIDDIREEARATCEKIFPDLRKRRESLINSVEILSRVFGFSKKTEDKARGRVALQDEKKDIIQKLYDTEAKEIASLDAEVLDTIEAARGLDPHSPDYEKLLCDKADILTENIPYQNKCSLAHYYARRALVLNVFYNALFVDKNNIKVDEALFHNLFFRKQQTDPFDSDLWIFNEECIFYEGTSDIPLKNVEYKGKKLLLDAGNYSEIDLAYLTANGQDKLARRPDILLFPEEGKCAIIELKNPNTDISAHLAQVNKYAALIYEYCNPEFNINKFYTYLIGENLDFAEVRIADSAYKPAPNFGYLYGSRAVPKRNPNLPDADQYMEAHSYKTILERAFKRNQIFLELLTKRQ